MEHLNELTKLFHKGELTLTAEDVENIKKRNNKSSPKLDSNDDLYLNHSQMNVNLSKLVDTLNTSGFISLLETYLNKYSYDINFGDKTNGSILMYCIRKNNNKLVEHLLNKYKNIIDLDKRFNSYNAFEYSNILGHYHLGDLIRLSKLGINLENKVKKYETNNEKINGISQLFNHYFQIKCNLFDSNQKSKIKKILNIDEEKENVEKQDFKTYDRVMLLLEETLIDLINNKKPFSNDLFKIVWDYNINKIGNNYTIDDINKMNLWASLKKQLEAVLNIKNVSQDKIGWQWFKNNLLESNIWLFPLKNINKIKSNERITVLYDELIKIVNKQLEQQKDSLKVNMKKLITYTEESELYWNKICTSLYFKSKLDSRQDKITNGIISDFNINEFNKLSINSSVNLLSLYDYNNYVTNLIITGNILNNNLKLGIKKIFDQFINDKKCFVQFGRVKTLSRCQEKGQLDYINSPFPTTASIIDIIRCSITFDDLKQFYNGILHCINSVINNRNDYIIDIIRLKNGFEKEYKKFTEDSKEEKNDVFLPDRYLDIKLNVIVTNGSKSLIGEVQFLIKPMLDNKKENHELYEIKRINDILKTCSINLPYIMNINNKLKIAITSNNKKELISILSNNLININEYNKKLNNSQNNRTLLMECIYTTKDLSLFDILFSNIILDENILIRDKVGNNILHYITNFTNGKKASNQLIFKNFINNLLKYDKNNNHKTIIKLVNEKNNQNIIPFGYGLNSAKYLMIFHGIISNYKNNLNKNLLYENINKLLANKININFEKSHKIDNWMEIHWSTEEPKNRFSHYVSYYIEYSLNTKDKKWVKLDYNSSDMKNPSVIIKDLEKYKTYAIRITGKNFLNLTYTESEFEVPSRLELEANSNSGYYKPYDLHPRNLLKDDNNSYSSAADHQLNHWIVFKSIRGSFKKLSKIMIRNFSNFDSASLKKVKILTCSVISDNRWDECKVDKQFEANGSKQMGLVEMVKKNTVHDGASYIKLQVIENYGSSSSVKVGFVQFEAYGVLY